MWFVKHGDEYLHDPRVGLTLLTTKPVAELNKSTEFNFQVAVDHPLYDKLKERDPDKPIIVYQGDEIVYKGEIIDIKLGFQNTKEVTCNSDLGYFNQAIVRPYSTLAEECDRTCPTTGSGYFKFLLDEYNSQASPSRQFKLGTNQGDSLDPNNYLYRADSTYPTVGSVIKSKILDSIGGYLRVRYEKDGDYIDLLSDMPDVNAQVIDFGVNLLDFVKDDQSDDIATFVVPLGKDLEKDEEKSQKLALKLTVSSDCLTALQREVDKAETEWKEASDDVKAEKKESYDEAKAAYNDAVVKTADGKIEEGYRKKGDIIYSERAVKEYGWIGATVEFSDVGTVSNLISKGLLALKSLESPITTIEVKAIDLSMIKPDLKPIKLGDYIRVRSNPHNLDSYFLVTKIEYDLNNPQNNTFTLGTTFDTLTGQQNKRINALNATINTVYETADKISAEAKANAIILEEAVEKINYKSQVFTELPDSTVKLSDGDILVLDGVMYVYTVGSKELVYPEDSLYPSDDTFPDNYWVEISGGVPEITASKFGTTTTIKVDGEDIATVEDGISPTITLESTETGATITVEKSGETTQTVEIANGQNGEQGVQGYSIVASVSRNTFAEANWTTYGTVGHSENWSSTSSLRNGCRVGDIFTVVGTATDTKNAHVLYYRSTTASGDLKGTCISHSIAERGEKGDTPEITASKVGTTTTIKVDGEEIATVTDGTNGTTPTITATKSGTVTTIKANGTAIATVNDGANGTTPTVTASKSGDTTTIKVNGTAVATVKDGAEGYTPVKGTDYFTSSEIATIETNASNTAINSIEIGGTNLISSDMTFNYSFANSTSYAYYGGVGGNRRTAFATVQPNTQYTFSFYDVIGDRLAITEYNSIVDPKNAGSSTILPDRKVVWKSSNIGKTYTFTTSENAAMVGIYYAYQTAVEKVKLEKGNKATDWTPAPEDVEYAVEEASKTATNYMEFVDGTGLIVGDMTSDTLGKNTLIDANGMAVRDNETELARFGATKIELGKNSDTATISMRNDSVKFYTIDSSSTYGENSATALECSGNFDIRAKNVESAEVFQYGGVETFMDNSARQFRENRVKLYASQNDGSGSDGFGSANVELLCINDKSTGDISTGITLNANDYINTQVPVQSTRDCNTFTAGMYELCYVGTSGTNRPPASSTATKKNGWLETMAYQSDYAYQKYVTYDGNQYERNMNGGTWGAWTPIKSGYIWTFYESAGGTTTDKKYQPSGSSVWQTNTFDTLLTGDSNWTEYLAVGSSAGGTGYVKFLKAGRYRIIYQNEGYQICLGIFNGSTEEYSAWVDDGQCVLMADLNVSANATRIIKWYGGSGSTIHYSAMKKRLTIEYLGA